MHACTQYNGHPYLLQEAWKSRLISPVIKKLEMDKFFFEVERKFAREKRGSAIDVDLFAQAAQVDIAEDLLQMNVLNKVVSF